MSWWAPRARRNVLLTISFFCLLIGATLLYAQRDLRALSRAGTPAVAALLGLILLPGATLATRRIERRAGRIRRT